MRYHLRRNNGYNLQLYRPCRTTCRLLNSDTFSIDKMTDAH